MRGPIRQFRSEHTPPKKKIPRTMPAVMPDKLVQVTTKKFSLWTTETVFKGNGFSLTHTNYFGREVFRYGLPDRGEGGLSMNIKVEKKWGGGFKVTGFGISETTQTSLSRMIGAVNGGFRGIIIPDGSSLADIKVTNPQGDPVEADSQILLRQLPKLVQDLRSYVNWVNRHTISLGSEGGRRLDPDQHIDPPPIPPDIRYLLNPVETQINRPGKDGSPRPDIRVPSRDKIRRLAEEGDFSMFNLIVEQGGGSPIELTTLKRVYLEERVEHLGYTREAEVQEEALLAWEIVDLGEAIYKKPLHEAQEFLDQLCVSAIAATGRGVNQQDLETLLKNLFCT